MKNAKLTSVLLGITAVSAILSILLVGAVHLYARQMRALQQQIAFINQSAPMINSLAVELNEYAKKNPSLDPILISTQFKIGAQPQVPPTAKPATR